jgi:hypothetical protein
MEGPDAPGPILTVAWRGHRVSVSADGWLGPDRPSSVRRMEAHSLIAWAIAEAASPGDIGPALEASPVGRTHVVSVGLADGGLEVSLRERTAS